MRALAAILLCIVAFVGTRSPPQATPSVRFHHFHFRVADPAAAMNQAATSLRGTRVLLRGLGVGVRVGAAYALFDRIDVSAPGSRGSDSIETAYDAARGWLSAHGIGVNPDADSTRTDLAGMFASEQLDHIAFTTADTSAIVALLVSRGDKPIRQTDDSRLFKTDRAGVEIVRDLDAPDAFWCPMHPDIRSSVHGKCPLCGMELVSIPPPRIGEYRMDVAVTPGARGLGASRFRITIRDPATNQPVTGFTTVHERLLHLFIIDRTLEFYRHVHPRQVADGTFELTESVPPGEFVVIADFLPQTGRAQMLQRAIVTPGYRGSVFPAIPDLTPDASTEKVDHGVRVRLDGSNLKASREAILTFTLSDVESGAPVSDLEPYLGAPGHVLIVSADLTTADHVHPEEPATRGPVITFQPMMPASGVYKLWLQFQRHGVVATVPFVISVAGP